MRTWLPFVLAAALFLTLQLFWCRPPPVWLRRLLRGGREQGRQEPPPPPAADQELFTLAFVQHRMRALTAELDRLDRDEGVYAKAFRMHAARSAYEALAADAIRLAAVSTVDLEITRSTTPLREELRI